MFGKTLRLGLSVVLLLVGVVGVAAAQDVRLPDAAMKGDLEAVRSLLAEGIDVNLAHGDGNTALHWATYRRNAEMVGALINAGADSSARTRIGEMTPLFMASKVGDAEIMRLLLEAGADATLRSTTGTTPLMLAAGSGKVAAVGLLLENGADVNSRDVTNGQTAAMFAAALNRGEVISMLAEHGADLGTLSKVSYVQQGRRARVDDELDERTVQMGGNAALHFAAREGAFDAIRALVAAGAEVDQVSGNDGTPPITQALITGNLDIAMFLLESGADTNISNSDGLAPLYATLDARFAQRTWYPPPTVAQEETNYLDLMKALLAKGADPNARLTKRLWYRQFGNSGSPDRAGATPFWRATQAHDMTAMKLLLDAGGDPNINTLLESSALMVASGIHYSNQGLNYLPDQRFEIVKFLVEELGADVNHKDETGHTSLHGAALIGNHDIVRYLVDKGADVTARANTISGSGDGGGTAQEVDPGTGDTAADMANGWSMNSPQYPETVQLLISLGSPFANTCWASNCVNPTISDEKVNGKKNQ